jgi:hypothetical protein
MTDDERLSLAFASRQYPEGDAGGRGADGGRASEQVVRTVTENWRTLTFTSQGFEKGLTRTCQVLY